MDDLIYEVVNEEWESWDIGETPVLLVAMLLLCMIISGVAAGPLWKDRRVGMSLATPVEEATMEKEQDRKLQQLRAIDQFNQEMVQTLNENWRKSLMTMCQDPDLQSDASSAFAEIVQREVNVQRAAMGLPPVDHLTNQNNIEAMVAEDMEAKRQLWQDLLGHKDVREVTPGDTQAAAERKRLDKEFNKTFETGQEPQAPRAEFFRKLFEVQNKAEKSGQKLDIPIEFFDTFADKFLDE